MVLMGPEEEWKVWWTMVTWWPGGTMETLSRGETGTLAIIAGGVVGAMVGATVGLNRVGGGVSATAVVGAGTAVAMAVALGAAWVAAGADGMAVGVEGMAVGAGAGGAVAGAGAGVGAAVGPRVVTSSPPQARIRRRVISNAPKRA